MKKINYILRVIVIAYLTIFIAFNIILTVYSLKNLNYEIIDNLSYLLFIFFSIILLIIFYKHKNYTKSYFQKIILVSSILFISPFLKLTLDLSTRVNIYYVLIINIPTYLALLSTVNIYIESEYTTTTLNTSKKIYIFLYFIITLVFLVIVVLLSNRFIYLNLFQ